MSTFEQKQPGVVRRRFGRVARRYDLLNRVMTFGRDQSWRREAVGMLAPEAGERILDAGAGTGDLILLAARKSPGSALFACDLTPEMTAIARARARGDRVNWVIADAQRLPFAPGSFDGVISGFLLRNMPDTRQALDEQARVTAACGRVVVLDTTPPRNGPLRPLAAAYLRRVVPLLGRLIAGNEEDYQYLQQSTNQFLSAEQIAARLREAGLERVRSVCRMLGTVAILRAERSDRTPPDGEKTQAR